MDRAGYDAVELLNLVRSDEYNNRFLSLTGKKIGPLWVRLLDEEIHELDRLENVDIPVDSRILSITNRLMGTDYSKAQARNFWREICDDKGLVPVKLDQPLWLLDKFVDEGDEYFEDGQQVFEAYLEDLVNSAR